MTSSACYSRDADVAAAARVVLDETAELVDTMEASQRAVVAKLVSMWDTSAWLAAGLRSAKQWLVAHTGLSYREAHRLEAVAELCSRDERLAHAVTRGTLPLGRAEKLAQAVTPERAPFLTASVDSFLSLAGDDDGFDTAVRYWIERVDEHLAPRRIQTQTLTYAQHLFGGGDIHASLNPVAFATVTAAIDAHTQDPDPADAPYTRTLSERRADGLEDLSVLALTHDCDTPTDHQALDDPDHEDPDHDEDDEVDVEDDCFDGTGTTDLLDEALDPANEDLDDLELLRAKIRRTERHQRRRAMRRVRARSGACVNVLIDLRTLTGTRELDDLEDLTMHGQGWNLTRAAAEQLLCDTQLVATLFAGQNKIIDANDAAERFSKRQRRAIAARDRHCVFPGCTRHPEHCDTHHLEERHHGGPTTVANGCLLCRFHHRLLHQHRWKLRPDTNGTWIATDPHGIEWKHKPTPAQAA